MVAAAWRPLSYVGRHRTTAWLEALPADVHRGDARLCVASAVTAIGLGQLDEVGVDRAGRPGSRRRAVPRRVLLRALAAANCLRSVHNWLTGDLTACRESALEAVDAGDGLTVGSLDLHLARCRHLLAG